MRKSLPSKFRVRPGLGFGAGLLLLVAIAVIGATRIDELESEITALFKDKNVKKKSVNDVIDELDDVDPAK